MLEHPVFLGQNEQADCALQMIMVGSDFSPNTSGPKPNHLNRVRLLSETPFYSLYTCVCAAFMSGCSTMYPAGQSLFLIVFPLYNP